MAHEAQLAWERRTGRIAAAGAFAFVGLLLASTVYRVAAVEGRPSDDREALITIDRESADFIVASVLQALSLVALVVVLLYLYRATKYRRPELYPAAAVLGALGPLLLAAGAILAQLDRVDAAEEFTASGVTSGRRGEERAEDLLGEPEVATQATSFGGQVALAFALVIISLNAMRAGLLSRFLGILGIVTGAVYVLPLIPPLIIQLFWVGALGALFVGRWPGGRGPAWDSGEAVPWPSAAEVRARAMGEGDGEPPHAEPGAAPERDEPPEPRPASRKRKRRRRS